MSNRARISRSLNRQRPLAAPGPQRSPARPDSVGAVGRCRPRGLVLVAIGLGLCVGCGRSNSSGESEPPPAVVKWEAPRPGPLEEWTELSGTTTPLLDRTARVSAPVEGRVETVLADAEGKTVEKGTLLVQLDDTIVRHNQEKAQAAQEVLREEERQAKLTVELAQSEVDRLAKLRAEEGRAGGNRTQLVSPVDVQKAEFALKDAQSKFKAASGRVLAGSKEFASLQAQLKLLSLTAPISGRVGRIQVVRGQTLAVGAPVAEIIDIGDRIDVLCYVPPSMIGKFQVGQPAKTGGFDSTESPVAEGQVQFIADQAEPETGNFAMKVRFSNKDARLKANRVLRIRVRTKPPRECLSLPESAVQEDQLPPTVVVVTDVGAKKDDAGKEMTTGTARRIQATLGVRDRILHQVEIVRLEDPEKDPEKKWHGEIKDALFVTEGAPGLQTGDAVKREE